MSEPSKQVENVVIAAGGPIGVDRLGVILPHEHVLIDLDCYWDPAGSEEAADPDRPVTMELLGRLRFDPVGVTRSNLRLDEEEVALHELKLFKESGGSAIVDLTPRGTNPRPQRVAELARQAHVHLILGTGYYLSSTHPAEIAEWSEEQIAGRLASDVTEGFGESALRAGIIGEIGTSDPITESETRILRAAAMAQRDTGVSLNVHLQEWGANGHTILDLIESADGDVTRTVLSHLDSRLDIEYHRSLLDRGAWVEYDLFGTEEYRIREGRRNPTDEERLEAITELMKMGFGDRLLLSSDVCTKTQLVSYGGPGYGHLLSNVVPRLSSAGFSIDDVQALIESNPARMLAVAP